MVAWTFVALSRSVPFAIVFVSNSGLPNQFAGRQPIDNVRKMMTRESVRYEYMRT